VKFVLLPALACALSACALVEPKRQVSPPAQQRSQGLVAAVGIHQGQMIVRQRCSGCHSTGLEGASPRADAPPLRNLYKRYPIDGLRTAFQSGVHVGHQDMPTFRLSTAEVESILAYLKSIDPCMQPSSDQSAMKRCFAPL
jgi:cytochrome c